MKIKQYSFPSATKACTINGNIYTNEQESFDTVVVLHHGMAEHQKRYLGFIEYLTENSCAVYMHDMANHGISNQDPELKGYFGDKDGYKALVADFNTTFEKAKSENPDKKLVVMGHSMGSFIVRCFTAWYSNAGFDGAIYMGSGGANPMAALGDKLSALVAKIKGTKHKSKFIDSMAFGSYNKKFEKRTGFDWLTRDTAIVDKYIADEDCGFLFSAQGYNDLIKLNALANTDEWYNSVPESTPILVISGAEDPVGEYSKGINQIGDKLKATAHNNVTVKLYPDCRHEILNELNKDEVYADVLGFIKSV